MPSSPVLSIRLIRDGKNSSDDDRITICRKDGHIRIGYYDARSNSKTSHSIVLTRVALSAYIKNLCVLFANDADPFEEFQINFPGFPCFMLNQNTIHNVYTKQALEECATIVSNSWFADVDDVHCECDCDC
jgi:hypothetical protein